eukprot:1424118-Pleurochrysis_carterae.AAC.4
MDGGIGSEARGKLSRKDVRMGVKSERERAGTDKWSRNCKACETCCDDGRHARTQRNERDGAWERGWKSERQEREGVGRQSKIEANRRAISRQSVQQAHSNQSSGQENHKKAWQEGNKDTSERLGSEGSGVDRGRARGWTNKAVDKAVSEKTKTSERVGHLSGRVRSSQGLYSRLERAQT